MTSALLDTFSIVANVTYIGFMLAAILRQHRGRTVASLIKACQHYWTAAALATLVLIINVIDIPNDGWASPAINTVTLLNSVTAAVLAGRTRDAHIDLQREIGRES